MADENVNNGQEGETGQTRAVMPTSTTNVTTRRLGQVEQDRRGQGRQGCQSN